MAYWHTLKPPKTIKPADNVQIQLCSINCCTMHSIDDPDCKSNVNFYKDLVDWGKISKNIMIWNYNTNFRHYDLPLPNIKSIGDNVRLFRDCNTKGVFMQSAGNSINSEMSDLKNWVISQCLWKPGRDSWNLALQFCRMHYGKAAGPIIEWLSFYHNHCELSGRHPGCFASVRKLNLTPEIALKAKRYFDQAMQLAENNVIARRVEKASICAYRALIDSGKFIKNGERYEIELPYPEAINDYKILVKKYKTSHAAEQYDMQEYFHKIEARKILTLENEFWKIEILPTMNVQIPTIIYKPTGLRLVRGVQNTRYNGDMFEETMVLGMELNVIPNFEVISFADNHAILRFEPESKQVTLVKEIWLDLKEPEKVFFASELIHNGQSANSYQVRVRANIDMQTDSDLDETLSMYIYDKGEMVQLTESMIFDDAKVNEIIQKSQGGQFTVVNNHKKFGLKLNYNTSELIPPRVESLDATPTIKTRAINLDIGQGFQWSYSLEYVDSL